MSRTLVHLVRHGKVHNPQGILYGRLPGFHLAASGRAMAAGLADYFSDHDIAYLATSSLIRAQETAAPLAGQQGLTMETDDRLIEATNSFEGKRIAVGDGALGKPRYWPLLRNPLRPSWGEPYLDQAHRMIGAAYTAVAKASGREAVLVSHQLPIWTLRRYLEGRRLWHNPAKRECAVASVTSLIFEDGVYQGLHYAEPVAHIPAVDDDGTTGPEAGA